MVMHSGDVSGVRRNLNFSAVNSTVAAAVGIASAGTTIAGDLTKIRVLGGWIIGASAGNVYFGSDSAVSTANGIAGNSSAFIGLQAGGGFVLPIDPTGIGYFQTSAASTGGAIHLNFISTTTGPWAGVVVWVPVK